MIDSWLHRRSCSQSPSVAFAPRPPTRQRPTDRAKEVNIPHLSHDLLGALIRETSWPRRRGTATKRCCIILLAALLIPRFPAGAQEFEQSPAPTADDAAPGVDNTANENSLPVEYRHRPVFYRSPYPPGAIIVNTADRFLYFVMSGTTAMRYAVGVGRDGFQWGGTHRITRKQEWPDWTPPPEMIERQPYLPRFMAGGPGNPMGARALYIGTTVYRIHGTNAPETIGHAVSSGCFRLVNGEIADLYDRVAVGSTVIVQHR